MVASHAWLTPKAGDSHRSLQGKVQGPGKRVAFRDLDHRGPDIKQKLRSLRSLSHSVKPVWNLSASAGLPQEMPQTDRRGNLAERKKGNSTKGFSQTTLCPSLLEIASVYLSSSGLILVASESGAWLAGGWQIEGQKEYLRLKLVGNHGC